MALAAYRHLLRSTRIAFQGDAPVLRAARAEARTLFQKNANLLPSDPAVALAVKHAEEVANILIQNVVQGKKLDGEEDRYKLRIHERTERGDNDTVKMPDGQKVVIDGKSCADR